MGGNGKIEERADWSLWSSIADLLSELSSKDNILEQTWCGVGNIQWQFIMNCSCSVGDQIGGKISITISMVWIGSASSQCLPFSEKFFLVLVNCVLSQHVWFFILYQAVIVENSFSFKKYDPKKRSEIKNVWIIE